MQVAQARPPYVRFQQVTVEDRNASIEAGRRITKNVDMAFIMQPGSKDEYEKDAREWLASIRQGYASEAPNAFPLEWVMHFERQFNDWKDGVDSPVPEGETSLREVPFVSPAEVENYASIKIFSVEAAANMTEEAMNSVGMGARTFRDKCRAYLEAANNSGKAAERIADLESKLRSRDDTIAGLEQRLARLEAQAQDGDENPEKRRPGRPRKDEQLAA